MKYNQIQTLSFLLETPYQTPPLEVVAYSVLKHHCFFVCYDMMTICMVCMVFIEVKNKAVEILQNQLVQGQVHMY